MSQTFDQKAVTLGAEAMTALLKEVPELRSVAIVFDWGESRNAHEIGWIFADRTEDPRQLEPESVYGLLGQLRQFHRFLFQHIDMFVTKLMGKHSAVAHQQQIRNDPVADRPGAAAAAPAD